MEPTTGTTTISKENELLPGTENIRKLSGATRDDSESMRSLELPAEKGWNINFDPKNDHQKFRLASPCRKQEVSELLDIIDFDDNKQAVVRPILKKNNLESTRERKDWSGTPIANGRKSHRIGFKEMLIDVKEVENWKEYNVIEDEDAPLVYQRRPVSFCYEVCGCDCKLY